MSREEFKVGDYVKFIDPAIEDYDVEDREDVLNRVYRIENINGDVYLLCADGIEVEALEHEMVKTTLCTLLILIGTMLRERSGTELGTRLVSMTLCQVALEMRFMVLWAT